MTEGERIERYNEIEDYIKDINKVLYRMALLGDVTSSNEDLRISYNNLKNSAEKLKGILQHAKKTLATDQAPGGDE